jgi:hypothetical protein
VQHENISEPLDEGGRDGFGEADAGDALVSEQLLEVCEGWQSEVEEKYASKAWESTECDTGGESQSVRLSQPPRNAADVQQALKTHPGCILVKRKCSWMQYSSPRLQT